MDHSKIDSSASLQAAIAALEIRRAAEQAALRAELHRIYESLQPIQLIRSTYDQIISSRDIRSELIDAAVGLTAHYASRTIADHVAESETGPGAAGNVLIAGLTEAISRHPEVVRSVGAVVFQMMRNAAQSAQEEAKDTG